VSRSAAQRKGDHHDRIIIVRRAPASHKRRRKSVLLQCNRDRLFPGIPGPIE
jgi:hypothetical protein